MFFNQDKASKKAPDDIPKPVISKTNYQLEKKIKCIKALPNGLLAVALVDSKIVEFWRFNQKDYKVVDQLDTKSVVVSLAVTADQRLITGHSDCVQVWNVEKNLIWKIDQWWSNHWKLFIISPEHVMCCKQSVVRILNINNMQFVGCIKNADILDGRDEDGNSLKNFIISPYRIGAYNNGRNRYIYNEMTNEIILNITFNTNSDPRVTGFHTVKCSNGDILDEAEEYYGKSISRYSVSHSTIYKNRIIDNMDFLPLIVLPDQEHVLCHQIIHGEHYNQIQHILFSLTTKKGIPTDLFRVGDYGYDYQLEILDNGDIVVCESSTSISIIRYRCVQETLKAYYDFIEAQTLLPSVLINLIAQYDDCFVSRMKFFKPEEIKKMKGEDNHNSYCLLM